MARRRVNVFSLSFLDVMSCGFGAVVLIFLIINHASEEEEKAVNKDLLSEVRLLDYQVQNGERDLFELQERMDALSQRIAESKQQMVSTRDLLDKRREDFETLSEESIAQEESLKALKSDIDTREEELERLRALEEATDGARIRSFSGEGDRQYLTGLKVGGKNILIAVDTSASMLDDTIVNIIRRRNMDEGRRRLAPKWQRAVRTAEWLAAQLPLDASFQVYGFNVAASSVLKDHDGQWIPLGEGRELDDALHALEKTVPEGGSSLANLVSAIGKLQPAPDNVYLIVDSLPTQGTREPRGSTVSGRERLELFSQAVNQLPRQIPINVILFPMEGDPMASAAYWNLARASGGSFLSPSKDWP